MAIKPEDIDNTDPSSPGYPYGSAKNESSEGAFDGTGLLASWVNDTFGFNQKLLDVAGVVPSGVADTILASDYFNSLITIFPFMKYITKINYKIGDTAKGSDLKNYKCFIANGPSSSIVDPVGDLTGTWVKDSIQVVEYLVSGTYEKKPGLKYLIVEGQGGGAGSGAATTTGSNETAIGIGGSGGGYFKTLLSAEDLSASETVTIGDGGALGTTSIIAEDGGDTLFGAFGTAFGGLLGILGDDLVGNYSFPGVDGGLAVVNSGFVMAEIPGGPSDPTFAHTAIVAGTSKGGDSVLGKGGRAPAANGAANAGIGYGSGGSGASNSVSLTAKTGADGMPGKIIITEFYED